MAKSAAAAMAVAMVALVTMAALLSTASAAPCAAVTDMLPCLSAVRSGAPPSAACCAAVDKYAQGGTPAGEDCLCKAVTNPTAKNAGMNLDYAIHIPQKCNLNYKAGYYCAGKLIPGGHP